MSKIRRVVIFLCEIIALVAVIVLLNSDGILPLIGLALIVLMIAVPLLLKRRREKQAEIEALYQGPAENEEEKLEEAIFNQAIYLIKPEKWKSDVVYKVVPRDGQLYFYRVGGQFYDIDPEIAANDSLSEDDLLKHKKSFSIPISEITQVEINTKQRMHTGNIPVNGSAYITIAAQKHDFIIHPINEYTRVEEFFKGITKAPVTVEIDEKTRAAELEAEASAKAAAEAAQRSPERFARLAKVCKIMNILGGVYFVWAVILSFPRLPIAIAGLLLPVISFVIYLRNKDIVVLLPYAKIPGTAKMPGTSPAICLSAIGLLVFTLTQYNYFHTARSWVIVIIATAALSVFVLRLSAECKRKKILYFLVPLVVFAFVYGALISTNIEFDTQVHPDPSNHQYAQIERMRISSGDYTDWHYLTLSVIDHPGNMDARLTPDNFDINVSRSAFDRAEEGNIVRLCVLPGLWGIAWVSCVTMQAST